MAADILRIATRQSPLALWQAEHVARLLRERQAGLRVELVRMTTKKRVGIMSNLFNDPLIFPGGIG